MFEKSIIFKRENIVRQVKNQFFVSLNDWKEQKRAAFVSKSISHYYDFVVFNVVSRVCCLLSKNLSLSIIQIKEGRQYILDKSKGIFLALLPHLDNNNIVRRRGLLGMIRYIHNQQTLHLSMSHCYK